MPRKFKKLSHTIYECKYHVVWCPKYRFRVMDGQIRYCVSTIGLDEERIKKYVRWQQNNDK